MPVVPWEKIWLCVSSMSWSWAFHGKSILDNLLRPHNNCNSFVCSSRIQSLSLFFWSKLCLYQSMCHIFIPHLCISAKEPEAQGSEISWSNLFQIQTETLSNLDLLVPKPVISPRCRSLRHVNFIWSWMWEVKFFFFWDISPRVCPPSTSEDTQILSLDLVWRQNGNKIHLY